MGNVLNEIVDGIKNIAPTVANLVMPGTGPLLHTLMRAVTGDGESPIEKVAETIKADPKMYLELQRVSADREVRIRECESKDLETVNITMRAEGKSEHMPQWLWRPFNGFLFPLAIIAIYFVLPWTESEVPDVPQWIWIGWGAVLGVTTWDRGKEKRLKAGENGLGIIGNAIKAIKG